MANKALVGALSDPSEEVRHLSALKLAQDPLPESVPALKAVLEAENVTSVVISMAESLATLGSGDGIALLRQRCERGEPDDRIAAASGLLTRGRVPFRRCRGHRSIGLVAASDQGGWRSSDTELPAVFSTRKIPAAQ